MRKAIWTGLTFCVLSATGCLTEKESKICTLSVHLNFCLTYNGRDSLPDTLVYIREWSEKVSPSSPIRRDTLTWEWERCLPEAQGSQRILVQAKDSVVFQSEWITVGSKDGCHADPATVDIRR
jgi:hypothetical protein